VMEEFTQTFLHSLSVPYSYSPSFMKRHFSILFCLVILSSCTINRTVVKDSPTNSEEEIVFKKRQDIPLIWTYKEALMLFLFAYVQVPSLILTEVVLLPVQLGCTKDGDFCGKIIEQYTRPKEAFPVMTADNQEFTPKLIKALTDSKPYVRRSAARALGEIGPGAKSAVPELVKSLSDNNSNVRRCASEALGKIGPDAVSGVPELAELVKDSNLGVRIGAVEALGKIGPGAAIGVLHLVKALTDSNSDVRRRAAESLGKIGPNAESITPLVKALDDSDSTVRYNATEALMKMGPLGKSELEKKEQQRELALRERRAAEEILIKTEQERARKVEKEEKIRIHKLALEEFTKIATYVERKGCVFALAMVRYPYGEDPYRISKEYLCVFNGSKGVGTINEKAGCTVVNLNGQTGLYNTPGGLPMYMLDGQTCSKRTVQELLGSDHFGDIDVKRISECATNVLDMAICPVRKLTSNSGHDVHLDFVAVTNKFYVPVPSDVISMESLRSMGIGDVDD